DAVSLPLAATDAHGLTLTYSASGLPAGLSLNSASGLISGTISTTADSGSPDTATVTPSDAPSSASRTFAWAVAHLSLASPGDQTSREGAAVVLQVSGKDA